MKLERILAQLNCRDLDVSTTWYETLFERKPDARPMDGLCEWHQGDGGLQLYLEADHAGHGTLTLIVEGLRKETERLSDRGLQPGPIEPSDTVSVVRLRDPDDNLVVLAEPGRV